MNFELTNEQKDIQKLARDFAEKELLPQVRERDESGEFPLEAFRKLGKTGIYGLPYPKEYGGQGEDYLSYILAVEEVSKVIDVNEGTIYPLLKRMTNERYFETYLRESTEGPPRKYYHLTAAGVLYRDSLEKDWNEFQERVCTFLREHAD